MAGGYNRNGAVDAAVYVVWTQMAAQCLQELLRNRIQPIWLFASVLCRQVAEWLRDFCARWLIHREGITMFMSELTTLIEPFIVAITILLGAFTIAGCMQKEQ